MQSIVLSKGTLGIQYNGLSCLNIQLHIKVIGILVTNAFSFEVMYEYASYNCIKATRLHYYVCLIPIYFFYILCKFDQIYMYEIIKLKLIINVRGWLTIDC